MCNIDILQTLKRRRVSTGFLFSLFSLLHSSMLQCCNVMCYLFLKNSKIKNFLVEYFVMMVNGCSPRSSTSDHPTERHTFSFWPCFIKYVLLIIDKVSSRNFLFNAIIVFIFGSFPQIYSSKIFLTKFLCFIFIL